MACPNRLRLARFFLLLLGTVFAALIHFIGGASLYFYGWAVGWEYIYNHPLLLAQVAFLFLVSGLSLLGIAVSLFQPDRLPTSRSSRILVVSPGLLYPLNGLFSLLAGGSLDLFLVANVAIEAAIGAVIALAIASAWLPTFRSASTDDNC